MVSVPRVHHMVFSRVVLLSVLEEVRLLKWLGSMALCQTGGTCPNPSPKQELSPETPMECDSLYSCQKLED